MGRHEARVAIITGGAGSIGFAIAQTLARGGARVALFDTNRKATEAAGRLPEPSDNHMAVDVDVTDDVDVGNAVSAVKSRYGRVDILVNCAGIVLRRDGKKLSLRELEPEDWHRSIEINLTAVYLCARAAVPAMSEGGWGRIVTISSQGGRTGGPFSSVDYGAAKAGVIGFSRTLAVETGKFGITVNCVAPGRVRTPMTAHPAEQAQNEAFLGSLPVPRMAETDEIAAAVAFLCSDEAAYITGTTLDVNGGGFMA